MKCFQSLKKLREISKGCQCVWFQQHERPSGLPQCGCTFRNSYLSFSLFISWSLSFSISLLYTSFMCSAFSSLVIWLTGHVHRFNGHSFSRWYSWDLTSSTDIEIVSSWKKLSTCIFLGFFLMAVLWARGVSKGDVASLFAMLYATLLAGCKVCLELSFEPDSFCELSAWFSSLRLSLCRTAEGSKSCLLVSVCTSEPLLFFILKDFDFEDGFSGAFFRDLLSSCSWSRRAWCLNNAL